MERVREFKCELNWVIRKSTFCHSVFEICRLGTLDLKFLLSCVQVVDSSLDNAIHCKLMLVEQQENYPVYTVKCIDFNAELAFMFIKISAQIIRVKIEIV